MTVIDVGEPDEREEEEAVGETSNPISFNKSLGVKAGVVCSYCRVYGSCSFLSFLCFLCLFLSLPPLFGISSTIFCKESIGE